MRVFRTLRYRVWVNDQMVYPETKDKPCEFLITQNGDLVSFPNKMDETYDPVRYERAIYMLYTGYESTWYPIYHEDVVRDSFGSIGVVTICEETGNWIVSYKNCHHRHLLSDYETDKELETLGNIYQHPDWENWDSKKEAPELT